jgi:hypothetical protein
MKYFTEYLPVEKKPMPGDLVKSNGQICKCIKEVSEGEYEVSGFPRFVSNIAKVQLFLCSRDIQSGDKCFCLSVEEGNSQNPNMWIDPWRTRGEGDNCTTCIKVIGEVSLDAVWVTEGMEFDEADIYYEGGFQGVIPDNYRDINGIIKFKCPTCKTFH